jgi:asparagine synthase (glutamine-hydrolysing)
MCGIYGITKRDREFVEKYIKICEHRGPDGHDIWNDDHVTLGHNLLSITDQPTVSHQPWRTERGNILIYNGEIFNYFDLIKKYTEFKPKTTCDTELLAWGLDHYGEKFVEHIDSMHAFAYYNTQTRQLILSRDHAGIKPLYYAETAEGLIFGSEIKGMLDRVPNSRKIDQLAISCMSLTGINATRNTFFTNVKQLMPGETIVYDCANKRTKSSERIYITPRSNSSFNPAEFRDKVKKTVQMSSIGRRQIGVFLSGGLDSSIVAYEMMQLHGAVNTFTNRMSPNVITKDHKTGQIEEDYSSDADAAKILAEQQKFNHKEVVITPADVIAAWEDSIYFMEQPVYNPSMSMYYHTNRKLSEAGTVITMAGDMGDEILGGYPKYWKMRDEKFNSWGSIIDKWLQRIKRPLVVGVPTLPASVLREELMKIYPDTLWNPADPVASYMALDCVAQAPNEFFARNDKYGMAFGMEGRFPLTTKMFMQYCLDIPTSYKIGKNKHETKLLTKIAYKGLLPDTIINKPKTGWTVPIGQWLAGGTDKNLKNFYISSMGEKSTLDRVTVSQKASKALVPAWQMKDWIKRYRMI